MEDKSSQPKTKTNRPLYKKWWFWPLAALVFFILIGAWGSTLPDLPESEKVIATKPIRTDTDEPAKPTYAFDVPSLFGKNIDELRQVLGEPVDKQKDLRTDQLTLGANTWWNDWENDGRHIIAQFDAKTRKVEHFFIDFEEGEDRRKPDNLLKVGNLKKGSPDYTITPVKEIKNPGFYTGITIIPR